MNVYEQSIVAYALPSLYHIYYLAPVDEEYRCGHGYYLWWRRRGEVGEERRGTITSIPDKKCDQRNSSGKSLCQKDTATFIRYLMQ